MILVLTCCANWPYAFSEDLFSRVFEFWWLLMTLVCSQDNDLELGIAIIWHMINDTVLFVFLNLLKIHTKSCTSKTLHAIKISVTDVFGVMITSEPRKHPFHSYLARVVVAQCSYTGWRKQSLATLWTGWCTLALINKSKVPCSYFPSINYQGHWMSVLQSYLALVKLLELTGIVLDTVAIRAHSPVPAASSEEAQYREPTIDLIWNAVKSMEELLWIRCHTNASGSLGYKIKQR